MKEYQNFIGIDIGKFNFVVAIYNEKSTSEYENTADGIKQFIKDYKDILSNTLIVLETTGGYELELLYTLSRKKYDAHRADTRKVKSFIRSFGYTAKTDILDAKALAHYGKERTNTLDLFTQPSKQSVELYQLVQRRSDLTKMLVAEKNRFKGPSSKAIRHSCNTMITTLTKQIDKITEQIKTIVNADEVLKAKQNVLQTIPGIGEIISFELLVLLPELGGKITRRKIASLAGLAPRANDSGKHKGYRRTGHGRSGIKPILFLAAMAARNSKSSLKLKEFYENLIARGKKKMVALTALMRKIIVIANARLRDLAIAGI